MADLTLVALHMEVLVQSDHTHGLLSARLGHDGLCADGAPGGILPAGQRAGYESEWGRGAPALPPRVQGNEMADWSLPPAIPTLQLLQKAPPEDPIPGTPHLEPCPSPTPHHVAASAQLLRGTEGCDVLATQGGALKRTPPTHSEVGIRVHSVPAPAL